MGFRFVNHYRSPVSVAIMYLSNQRCGHGQWEAEGWWNIAPNGSALVYGGDVNFNRYWYYHAHARDGALWEGPDMNVYLPGQVFVQCVNYASTVGTLRGFRLTDVGNYQNFTLTLTGGGQRID